MGKELDLALFTAPLIDFVQVDWNSTEFWDGMNFCADKEVYAFDANGNKK